MAYRENAKTFRRTFNMGEPSGRLIDDWTKFKSEGGERHAGARAGAREEARNSIYHGRNLAGTVVWLGGKWVAHDAEDCDSANIDVESRWGRRPQVERPYSVLGSRYAEPAG